MDSIPSATKDGLTFFPVPRFDGPSQAFGASESAFFNRRKLPEVPHKFKDIVNGLFFKGGQLQEFDPRVDRKLAMAAFRAWVGSFAPAHESKVATAAYALWVWTTPQAIDAALKAE